MKKGVTASAEKQHAGNAPDQIDTRLKGLLDLASEWYWEQDANYRFTVITGAAYEKAGLSLQRCLGKTRWDHGGVPVDDDGSWNEHMAALAAHQPFADFTYRHLDAHGDLRHILASGQPMFDEEKRFVGYCGIARDVTTSVRAEQLLRLEHLVARCLSEANSVSEMLKTVIRAVCETQDWQCGRYFGWDHNSNLLTLTDFWHVPDPRLDTFIEESRKVRVPSGHGLVGQAYRSVQPLWVLDLTQQPVLHIRIARDAGMRGAFLFSAIADGKPTGVFVFHSREVREPDTRLLEAVKAIGSQIGQALQRKQAEEEMRRFRVAMDMSGDMILLIDRASLRYIDANDTACRTLGYSREELLAIGPCEVLSMTRQDITTLFDEMFDGGKIAPVVQGTYSRKDGTQLPIESFPRAVRSPAGDLVIAVARDVTERLAAEARIQHLATHDALTNLPNRFMFSQLLNFAIQNAQRDGQKFAVLFIDLDQFKMINDTLGHDAGDQLLQEIAARFSKGLRTSDVLARLGGDEFVVLLRRASKPQEVTTVARKLLSAAARPLVLQGQECGVTASIGICTFPTDAQDEQSLMKNADSAMYLAKGLGKNNFQFYSESIRTQSLERLSLETALRHAIERSEFVLHYQAKLDLRTQEITGVEALLRWQHPDLGLVPPMKFMPIAEETGLVIPIGLWVLKTACAQNVAWQREGLPPLRIAINLSARQFADEKLLAHIAVALKESGMQPDLLELELTESMVMQNIEQAIKALAAIKKMGVRIAIDDFGVGYSSLAQIKRFPIDTLKVNRSFIRDLADSSEERDITMAIIAMGKALSLTVEAEGVETQEQQVFLTDHACDAMQGIHFSKPISNEEFANFMRQHLTLKQTQP